MNGSEPAHLVQYGHGLLGGYDEIDAGNVRAFANEHNAMVCATKWAGMSEDDVGNAITTLGEFSGFPTMADRLQQGVLNQIFLGRLMIRDGGLNSVAELKRADGGQLFDTAHLDYDGNSQGGIMGRCWPRCRPTSSAPCWASPASTTACCCPAPSTSTTTNPSSSRHTRTTSTGC
jgi:hypothetical protein